MIRQQSIFVASLLLVPPVFAATDPDAYKPINGIRTLDDVLDGIRAQSLPEYRMFLKSLAELEQLRPFPLLLDDGTEIFQVVTSKREGQYDRYYLNFRTQRCVQLSHVEKKLNLFTTNSLHGNRWAGSSTAYGNYAVTNSDCISAITLTEAIPEKNERLLFDGSISASRIATLLRDMELASGSDNASSPLKEIWRSLGSSHDDGVKVLRASYWNFDRSRELKYSFFFSDTSCIDSAPFAEFIPKKLVELRQFWTAIVRPSRPECLESLTYQSEAQPE